ncbi:MAG: terpene cyclase/mutase family protein [Planctomycetes bacterium]|nr:terpene cyclase/mutase family protein [Planctomycetota bacterium]
MRSSRPSLLRFRPLVMAFLAALAILTIPLGSQQAAAVPLAPVPPAARVQEARAQLRKDFADRLQRPAGGLQPADAERIMLWLCTPCPERSVGSVARYAALLEAIAAVEEAGMAAAVDRCVGIVGAEFMIEVGQMRLESADRLEGTRCPAQDRARLFFLAALDGVVVGDAGLGVRAMKRTPERIASCVGSRDLHAALRQEAAWVGAHVEDAVGVDALARKDRDLARLWRQECEAADPLRRLLFADQWWERALMAGVSKADHDAMQKHAAFLYRLAQRVAKDADLARVNERLAKVDPKGELPAVPEVAELVARIRAPWLPKAAEAAGVRADVMNVRGDAAVRTVPKARLFERREKRGSMVPAEVQQSVQAGLAWLAAHQDPDGSWRHDCVKTRCPAADCCDGEAQWNLTVGVTGLALLPFLAEGNTPVTGPHKEVVARGVKWLLGQQAPDGSFAPRMQERLYCHAIATLVLCESIGMTRDPEHLAAVERAVGFLEGARQRSAGWRYEKLGESDVSVTVWCVNALVAAREIGIKVDSHAFTQILGWLDAITEASTGETAYMTKGWTGPSRLAHRAEGFPHACSRASTAAALTIRALLGQAKSPIARTSADYVLALPPMWQDKYIDLYYWYHGAAAMSSMGGPWESSWGRHLREALVPHQAKDGHSAGSWKPEDPWSDVGGRVYMTAMALLALQSPYRYVLPK